MQTFYSNLSTLQDVSVQTHFYSLDASWT